MKKIFVLLVVLATALTANAQFEKGKAYLGASLSGFDKGRLSVYGQPDGYGASRL